VQVREVKREGEGEGLLQVRDGEEVLTTVSFMALFVLGHFVGKVMRREPLGRFGFPGVIVKVALPTVLTVLGENTTLHAE
jgi:hypothetical protein